MDISGGGLNLGGSLYNRNQRGQTSDQYFQMGQPYRDQLSSITANPNLYFNSPAAQALANQSDRRYSATVGNPAGSGTAQAGALEAMLRGYGNERDRLFNYGGGGYFNQAAPGARSEAMGANMGALRSLGPLMWHLGNQNWGSMFGGGGGSSMPTDWSSIGSGGAGMGFS